MEAAVRKTAPALGIELVDLPELSCCPDPVFFKAASAEAWLTLAARNLSIAEEADVDLVTICSGCTTSLAEASETLAERPDLLAQVNERLATVGRSYNGTTQVRHLVKVLRDEVGLDAIRASVTRPLEGARIAFHYGCHLLRPSEAVGTDDPYQPSILKDLVAALGATPVVHSDSVLCCGRGCMDKQVAGEIQWESLAALHRSEAEALAVVCPSCFHQFEIGQMQLARSRGTKALIPPVYYFQLLGLAQGLSLEELGFQFHKIKPEALLGYLAPAQLH
jgi:heterodisulfide reductase subunit B